MLIRQVLVKYVNLEIMDMRDKIRRCYAIVYSAFTIFALKGYFSYFPVRSSSTIDNYHIISFAQIDKVFTIFIDYFIFINPFSAQNIIILKKLRSEKSSTNTSLVSLVSQLWITSLSKVSMSSSSPVREFISPIKHIGNSRIPFK